MQLNSYIDHTNLSPLATLDDLMLLAKEARDCKFNSACVRSQYVKTLSGFCKISSTIAFPENFIYSDPIKFLGKSLNKYEEASKAILDGALELDPVIDLECDVEEQLSSYAQIITKLNSQVILKPIFSCEILDSDQIKKNSQIISKLASQYLQVKFVFKTSTGFVKIPNIKLSSPESIEEIDTYLNIFDPDFLVGIKVAGSISSYEQAIILLSKSKRISHIGTSQAKKICNL